MWPLLERVMKTTFNSKNFIIIVILTTYVGCLCKKGLEKIPVIVRIPAYERKALVVILTKCS